MGSGPLLRGSMRHSLLSQWLLSLSTSALWKACQCGRLHSWRGKGRGGAIGAWVSFLEASPHKKDCLQHAFFCDNPIFNMWLICSILRKLQCEQAEWLIGNLKQFGLQNRGFKTTQLEVSRELLCDPLSVFTQDDYDLGRILMTLQQIDTGQTHQQRLLACWGGSPRSPLDHLYN